MSNKICKLANFKSQKLFKSNDLRKILKHSVIYYNFIMFFLNKNQKLHLLKYNKRDFN